MSEPVRNGEYVFSTSEERFHSESYPTRAAAEADGRDEWPDAPDITIYTGRVRIVRFSDCWPWWGHIVDHMNEKAFEEGGEAAEDWPPQKLSAEAEQDLRAVLDAWAERHGLQPKWYAVDDIECHASGALPQPGETA